MFRVIQPQVNVLSKIGRYFCYGNIRVNKDLKDTQYWNLNTDVSYVSSDIIMTETTLNEDRWEEYT